MITAEQVRAARALLGIDQRRLAALAELSVPTIQRLESGAGTVRCHTATLMKLTSAFAAAGIAFLPEDQDDGGGRGVRFR
jgi:predicted transcriptional regulator